MTKNQAIIALRQGKKLTHRFFSNEEWIRGEGLMVVTDDDYSDTIEEFMSYRSHSGFDDGWSLFKTINPAFLKGKELDLYLLGKQACAEDYDTISDETIKAANKLREIAKDYTFKKPIDSTVTGITPIVIGYGGSGFAGIRQGIGKGLELEQKPIEIGRCLNCKYWAPEDGTLGLCDGIETSAYYKNQTDDAQISYIPEGHSGDVMNYSEFQLTTRDTFGCLNFKEE